MELVPSWCHMRPSQDGSDGHSFLATWPSLPTTRSHLALPSCCFLFSQTWEQKALQRLSKAQSSHQSSNHSDLCWVTAFFFTEHRSNVSISHDVIWYHNITTPGTTTPSNIVVHATLMEFIDKLCKATEYYCLTAEDVERRLGGSGLPKTI